MFNILDALKQILIFATTAVTVLNPFNATPQKVVNISPTPTEIIFQITPTPTITKATIPCGPGQNSGQYVYIKDASDCQNYTDCGFVDGSWKLMKKEECSIAQKQDISPRQNNNSTNIDCTGPDGKHSQKTQKECDDFNAAWEKPQQANRNNVPNNQSSMTNCQTQSGWVRMTKDDCTKAQNAWGNQILDNTNAKQQENQKIIDMFRSFEDEMWQATNLDQLDNLRERLRQIQGPDPSIQSYIGTLIRLIEERIKILQQQ